MSTTTTQPGSTNGAERTKGSCVYVVERSAVVPLDVDEAWEAFFGNDLQNWCELSDLVVEVRDVEWRADGTPRYVMVNRSGPFRVSHRSDYRRYEPPRVAVDVATDTLLGGRWTTRHEPVDGGTRVTHRWEVEPRGPMFFVFPMIEKRFARDFQRDLDKMVERLRSRRVTS